MNLVINAAALCFVAQFSSNIYDNEKLKGIFFEQAGQSGVKMTACNAHELLTFLLKEANVENKNFAAFKLIISKEVIQAIKPSKKNAYLEEVHILVEDGVEEVRVETTSGNVFIIEKRGEDSAFIKNIYDSIKNKNNKNTDYSIFVPIKSLGMFDFSKLWMWSRTMIIKHGEYNILRFTELPPNIDATGIIMGLTRSDEEYKLGVESPDWLE